MSTTIADAWGERAGDPGVSGRPTTDTLPSADSFDAVDFDVINTTQGERVWRVEWTCDGEPGSAHLRADCEGHARNTARIMWEPCRVLELELEFVRVLEIRQ